MTDIPSAALQALYPSMAPGYYDNPDPDLQNRSDLTAEQKAAWAMYSTMRAPRTSEAAPIDPGLAKIYPSMKPTDVRMPVPVPSDSAAPGQGRPPEQSSPAAASPALPPEVQAALGEYAVQLPETWQPDTVELTSARDLFRSLGLDAKQGGALLEHFVRLQERQAAADAARIEQWESQVAADAELGGVRLQETVAVASGAIRRFGNDALRQLLDRSGLGSHPEVVRFVGRMARALQQAERGRF